MCKFYYKYYKRKTEGLAMGAPTSAIQADILIKHMEHAHILVYPILKTYKIVAYYRYDDILYTTRTKQT
jgi:hypothetical protein